MYFEKLGGLVGNCLVLEQVGFVDFVEKEVFKK